MVMPYIRTSLKHFHELIIASGSNICKFLKIMSVNKYAIFMRKKCDMAKKEYFYEDEIVTLSFLRTLRASFKKL
jgi:predicted nucleic-acid-binding Zn-ribbon protein